MIQSSSKVKLPVMLQGGSSSGNLLMMQQANTTPKAAAVIMSSVYAGGIKSGSGIVGIGS